MANPGLLTRMREGLVRTRRGLGERVREILSGGVLGEEEREELEAVLLQADVGLGTTEKLIEGLGERVRREGLRDGRALLAALRDEMLALLQPGGSDRDRRIRLEGGPPPVVMVVGVNGSGKTTTVGKLAVSLGAEGKRVVIGAADTFRAAAGDQLSVWAEKSGADLVRHDQGGDPAAVAFDAVRAGRARAADVVLVDTAGRLHTNNNLMEELKKISRVVAREVPGAPHEVLLVLDATTGQNALQQARVFLDAVEVTGVVLTKLDGSARGGIVLAVEDTLGIPVKLVGLGEDPEDLRPFDSVVFVSAIVE